MHLPTNRLPDIPTVIPIENSFKYRFMNARFNKFNSHGQSKIERQTIRRKENALVTIEGFEKLFTTNETKYKKMRIVLKENKEEFDSKIEKFKQIRKNVRGRQ